jgi:hypothetical protein
MLAGVGMLAYLAPLLIERVGSSVVEQCPFKALAVGSSPTRPTTSFSSHFEAIAWTVSAR